MSHLSDFSKQTPTPYLLINKLKLQRITWRVHIDSNIPPAPGLFLHQDRAICRDTKHTHVITEILYGTGGKQKEQRAHTVASYTRLESRDVPGKYLCNLRLYSPGSHCAAHELHAAPGPLFCGSLKYFVILALQMTKYSNNHSQGLPAVPYHNSCCFEKYTGI